MHNNTESPPLQPIPKVPPEARPQGLTQWVNAQDVMEALSCSRSLAYKHLRCAAGRESSTRQILRVPVSLWERYAKERFLCQDADATSHDSINGATFGTAGFGRVGNGTTAPRNAATTRPLQKCKRNGSGTPLIQPAPPRGGRR